MCRGHIGRLAEAKVFWGSLCRGCLCSVTGVEVRHETGGLWVLCTGAPWHDVAKEGMSQGDQGALCAVDVLEGPLKWVQAGMTWDPQCRECHGGATGAEAAIGQGFLGCSAQEVPWQGGWNQAGHGLRDF